MALTTRQKLLYVHRFSLWKPTAVAKDANNAVQDSGGSVWPSTPTYTNIAGYFESTPNVNEPQTQGLQKQTNFFTNDKLHLELIQDISSGWLVKMTSDTRNSGNPAVGNFWVVQGAPDANARRANKLTVQLVNTPAPDGIS